MHPNDKKHRKVRKCLNEPNFSGQHLLHNPRIVRQIIDQSGIRPSEIVMDLGAGKGAMTFALAEKASSVVAIENDPRFAEILKAKSQAHANVAIIEKDIRLAYLPNKPFRVVANIPYAITTPILEKLLDPPTDFFQGAMLLIEYGAAKRFTSRPIRDPRILRWRMWFDLELIKVFPRTEFSPPPSVESAIFRIRRKADPYVQIRHHRHFAGFAEYALKRPELPIYVVLQGIFTPPQLKHLFKNLGVDRQAPICTLNERQWGMIFRTMLERVDAFRWPKLLRRK
ncbi:23S ribosomal RNA methyltransferase Erm [Paenibacillus azoreducens]|uniref:rRNA adenine N-6-methyltransferase n=1 Tax=Paenibacillus azoreducens TaxID=116718 RepID=A0A920CTT8_9BACL|nr:23S ribosomal RNA methyltransferase Erm [Paenibacillus azoreducens]GIO48793.1 ribosomal RNA small subunit methyltransferase A [Paenibacillus azoreducens]